VCVLSFVCPFNRVVRFNVNGCRERTVHPTERLPRARILKLAALWPKNFVFKRCVTEESANNRGELVCSLCECKFPSVGVHTKVFCFVLFLLFQVPLMSCASSWRVGETKNGASPKLKTFLRQLQNAPFSLGYLIRYLSYVLDSFVLSVCRSFYFGCADFFNQVWCL
jgi:hypothetical protein